MALVVLDPGHGGSDPGATNGGYQEKNFTLEIALKTRDYLLNNYHVDILMTRTTDTDVSLADRVALANNNGADYFVSIHINAGGGTGFESFIYDGSVSPNTVEWRRILHDAIMSRIGNSWDVYDRGKKRANFYVLRETAMSAVLTENLFIDTQQDLNKLTNSSFIADVARAHAEGIAQALSLSAKVPTAGSRH
ncbi:N-acetylmuramoyl-L-alanine amidase [Paludifilum halophilum]|uniref:N-acetylmuramoyl-L-alanine amidase n=1 Tax=Paludifilum halophilum TaxID=1642702 RepID=A0A235BBF9_9BACL|nr:N-acetylmuramoyl-L-alanine amidase [Paludifilum halophilum]OYD09644.1 N-acetylmuramoyl-L-alanine amidase [Paludifilum halophilum]